MRYFVCLLAGLATVFAFEPFSLPVIAFISLAVLFYFYQSAVSSKQAFLFGLAFGYGLFGAGVSWVYVSLSTYGGMPFWMGSIAVIGFAGLLSIFVGLVGYITVLLVPLAGLTRLFVLPPLWVIFEWLKGWVLTGFPWLEIGYSQTTTWLFALAPIGGVYLISFVAAIISCLIAACVIHNQRVPTIAAIFFVGCLSWSFKHIDWSTDVGQPITVGLVQGNVPIEFKWQANQRDKLINLYASQSHQLHAESPVDLFVWPETALPLYRQQTEQAFWNAMVPKDTAVLAGLLDQIAENETYNAAILSCDSQQQVYRKRHLVPFGEYLPLRFLFNWVLDYLQLPMSDFSSWNGSQSLSCPGNIDLSLSICYEDAFGSEWRHHLAGATLLVNISEDAWFGDSLAPHQRLQMAQMRAREFSRPLVRSANTGPSVIINQYGEVLASTKQFAQQTLTHTVQPQTGDTWYTRFGNWIVFLSIGIMALVIARNRRKK